MVALCEQPSARAVPFAYGTPDDIANRLREHLRGGANHVVIQVLGGSDKLLPTLSELAGALGLTPRP